MSEAGAKRTDKHVLHAAATAAGLLYDPEEKVYSLPADDTCGMPSKRRPTRRWMPLSLAASADGSRQHARQRQPDLDGWEYYKSSNLSHSEFLRRLRRMDPPSKAMHDGTMFHRYMETQGREFSHFFEWKCDVTMEKPTATEVPVTKKYEIGGRVVTLSRSRGRHREGRDGH